MLYIVFTFVFAQVCIAQTFIEGELTGLLGSDRSPYYVIGNVYVPRNESLRIMPGVEIIFLGHFAIIVDSGAALKAIGSPTDSILFTTKYPDIGHHGIHFFYSTSSCTIAYSRIEYGRADITHYTDLNSKGGGIFCYYASPVIMRNTITKCSAMDGGAIYLLCSGALVKNNLIFNNTAYDGGAIYCHHSNYCVFDGNIIMENATVYGGGGIFLDTSSPMIVNNLFIRNSPYYDGGAILCTYSSPLIINNTFYGNSAFRGGGIHALRHSKPIVVNNIFWNNRATRGESIHLRFTDDMPPCTLFLESSLVNERECIAESLCKIVWGERNYFGEPNFADSLCRLSPFSLAIDAGKNSISLPLPWDITITAPTHDIENNPRPSGPFVDLGSYEYQQTNVSFEIKREWAKGFFIRVWPVPFNSVVYFSVQAEIAKDGWLKYCVFDLGGKMVDSGGRFTSNTGNFLFEWKPQDGTPSGIYIVKVELPGVIISSRVIYLK